MGPSIWPLTLLRNVRLRSPLTWSPDTPPSLVSDTPTTSDTASLPLLPPSLPTLMVLWCPLSPRKWWMPVLSIWPPMLRHKLVGGSLIVESGRRDYKSWFSVNKLLLHL